MNFCVPYLVEIIFAGMDADWPPILAIKLGS
jgi:hypothetical protein